VTIHSDEFHPDFYVLGEDLSVRLSHISAVGQVTQETPGQYAFMVYLPGLSPMCIRFQDNPDAAARAHDELLDRLSTKTYLGILEMQAGQEPS